MSAERPGALAGVAAVGLGVCCGLPILLGAGALSAAAGSAALVLAGVLLATLARRGRDAGDAKPTHRATTTSAAEWEALTNADVDQPRRAAHADLGRSATGRGTAGAEYLEEHLPGSINLPLRQLTPETVMRLDSDGPIVVYCWDAL